MVKRFRCKSAATVSGEASYRVFVRQAFDLGSAGARSNCASYCGEGSWVDFFTSCDWLGWVTIGRGSSGVGKSWQGIAVPSNRYETSFGGVVLGGCASRTVQSTCMRVDASQFHASVCPFLTKLSTAWMISCLFG